MTQSNRPWLAAYPESVPADLDVESLPTLVDIVEQSFALHGPRIAYTFLGRDIAYAQVDAQSLALAAYFQDVGLKPGDRVAVMLPNVPQYPVAAIAALRAGLVLVNVNPLYTARELEHQLNDAGASAIIVLENFAGTLADCIRLTSVKHVVVARVGDMLGVLKGFMANAAVRHMKKAVQPYALPEAVAFNTAIKRGRARQFNRPRVSPEDMAVLQYTGGTTGVSKGATLLHRNIAANVLQTEMWNRPTTATIPADEQPTVVCALPLYHIYALTVVMLLTLRMGGKVILIPDARDLKGLLKTLAETRFHYLPAVNTLFNALLNHADFDSVDWSSLRLTTGGGMATQAAVAERWHRKTGCFIHDGYGMSEASPTVTANPSNIPAFSGTIGLPLPSTWVKCIDDDGREVPLGQPGEIAIKGPQVMAGYWKRPDETVKVMTADGYMRSGDMGIMSANGYVRIVDRKKDMVLVSGFNVYPNEVEDVVARMSGVAECAVVGVPDGQTGEAVKLVIVRRDVALNEADVRAFCSENLTAYKRPRIVEFRESLPKTPVGKILRRALRE